MKVYSIPDELPVPDIMIVAKDVKQYRNDCETHKESLKQWLANAGYTGKNTGKVIQFGVADGYAEYMVMEQGRTFALVHLPYWDAYQYRDVQFLSKKEIMKRIESQEKLTKLFGE